LPGIARRVALHGAGLLAWRQSDWRRARELAEQAVAENRAAGDRPRLAWAFIDLGLVAMRSDQDFTGATVLFEQALAIGRAEGQRWLIAMALAQLSAAARYEGRYDVAVARIEESAAIFKAMGDLGQLAYAYRLLGHALLERGDMEAAQRWYIESLRHSERGRRGPTWSAMECLEGIARILLAHGRCGAAARLFGAAETFRQTRGYPRGVADEERHAAHIAALRTALGEAHFEQATAEGHRLALEDAIFSAFAAADPEAPTARPDRHAASSDPLTSREREVAALVAAGQTNRDIAAALIISERTVDTHVQNILNKLGFGARAQIAAWAAERGLLTQSRRETSLKDAASGPRTIRPAT
jgi:non-specific serine/threonine protein kinase